MLQAGTVVAQHLRLVRQLGSGGMGCVWVAEHTRIGGHVAVKFLSTALLDHESARSRFMREAKWAAKIKSPHVVQVHDHGVTAGAQPIPYIVMELLEGRDLSVVLDAEGPLGLPRANGILEQICEALTKAHEAGVVHRDIKPENVFLLDQVKTFVKLLDFGVAHGNDGQIDRLTQTGLLLGTAHYMSPEQLFSGKNIDHRADLWALGVLTYQMIANQVPFQAETFGQLCLRVRDGSFPPVSDQVNVPKTVDQWFDKALCNDRAGRFQSAEEMGEAFRRAIAGEPLIDSRVRAATSQAHAQSVTTSALPDNGSPTGTVRIPSHVLAGAREELLAETAHSEAKSASGPEQQQGAAHHSRGYRSGSMTDAEISRGTLPSGEHPVFMPSTPAEIAPNTRLSSLTGSFGTESKGALALNSQAGVVPLERGSTKYWIGAIGLAVAAAGAWFYLSSVRAPHAVAPPTALANTAPQGSAAVEASQNPTELVGITERVAPSSELPDAVGAAATATTEAAPGLVSPENSANTGESPSVAPKKRVTRPSGLSGTAGSGSPGQAGKPKRAVTTQSTPEPKSNATPVKSSSAPSQPKTKYRGF